MDVCYHEGKVVEVEKKKFGIRSCFDLLKNVQKKKKIEFCITYNSQGIFISKDIKTCYIGKHPNVYTNGDNLYCLTIKNKEEWDMQSSLEETNYEKNGQSVCIKGIRFVDYDFELDEQYYTYLESELRDEFVQKKKQELQKIKKEIEIVEDFGQILKGVYLV